MLNKLEEQLEILRKTKANLDIYEAIAESTFKLCAIDESNSQIIETPKNNEFYIELDKELKRLENSIKAKFQ